MVGSIADILSRDPDVVCIVPSEYGFLPEVDCSVFSGDISVELKFVHRFLLARYVVDGFTDHEHERKPWLNRMYAKHGRDFWDYAVLGNALKRGNFAQISGGRPSVAELFAEQYCGRGKDDVCCLVDEIKQEHLSLADYDFLPVSLRVLHVRRMKSLVYDLLDSCSVKNSVHYAFQ